MQATQKYNPEVLDRIPPQNLDAEKSVLGSLLLDSDYCPEIAAILKGDEFYAAANQTLYHAIQGLYDEYQRVDSLLLLDRLEATGEIEAVGGSAYIIEIAHSVPWAHNAAYHARIVREKAAKRNCIHAAQELLMAAYEPAIDSAEWRLRADKLLIDQTDTQSDVHTKNATEVMVELSEAIDQSANERATLPWGFPEIDQHVGMMVAGEMIVIAARPSMGKSAFAMNIAEYNARNRRTVLFISIEMPAKDLASRSVCGEMGIDGLRLRNGLLTDNERALLTEGMARFSRLPFFICDQPRMTIADILRETMKVKRKHGLDLLIIDYLGLICGDNPKAKLYEKISEISKGVKRIAREAGCPLLCLCQLNRGGDDTTRPTLRELRDSGAIEEDADRVAFVVRARIEKDEKTGKRKYIGIGEKDDQNAMILFDKNRNCPIANIRLEWNPKAIRFESLPDYRPAERETAFDEFQ